MPEQILFGAGGASEATLAAILAELQQKLESGEEVTLSDETVSLLRSVAVTGLVSVDNFPASYPIPAEQFTALLAEVDTATVESLLTTIRDRQPVLSSGRVPVDISGGNINVSATFESFISTQNSTSTPLGANATWTGTWEDVKDYAAIAASFKTDQSSAPNGAILQFSEDGVNVLTQEPGTVPGGIGGFSVLAPQARYVRVVYTNGPVAQSYLRAEVRYLFSAPAQTQTAIGGPTSDLSISTLTKAHMQGRIMSGPMAGLWGAIGTDGAGNLMVAGTVDTGGLTNAELRAAPVDVADSGEREYTHAVATVTASGNTTVYTPAAGKAIRLRWIYAINDPTANTAPLIKISLGGQEIYRAWALSKRQRITGPVDGPLVINLSTAANVAVTAVLEEV